MDRCEQSHRSPAPVEGACYLKERTMLDVHRLLRVLGTRMGQEYDYHAQAPIWDGAWTGKWNCSSFLAWGLWQIGDRRMLGCRRFEPPHKKGHHSNATFPDWWQDHRIWASTGFFYE